MNEIKRFDMTVTDYSYMEDCRSESVIGEVSGGKYVLHSDYLAEVERLQARVSELNECLTKASEMVEAQGFYGPVVRRFRAALRANDAGQAEGADNAG